MITLADLLPPAEFLRRRDRLERDVVAAKEARRVALGPEMTFLFENRRTVLWQIQEMCRIEGIDRPDAVQHEIDTYAALLPGPRELSATLLVELLDEATRPARLRALVGIERHVRLEIDGVAPVPARFDGGQTDGARISSVQFVRFTLDDAQLAALRDLGRAAAFVCDHPAYAASARLSPAVRGALVEDLSPPEITP